MTKIIILTSSELRHRFFRKALALTEGIDVLRSYCEIPNNLKELAAKKDQEDSKIELLHLAQRDQAEYDFFQAFDEYTADVSHPILIERGGVNNAPIQQEIFAEHPDLLIAYGCSLVTGSLISQMEGRFLNVHLGLSPYYRGGGTNFWPLVRREPEYVGATFMHIDEGVDTGEIIHQIRARIFPGDDVHRIGNRLIFDMTKTFANLILDFPRLERLAQPSSVNPRAPAFRRKDFNAQAVSTVYANFAAGMIEEYLRDKPRRCALAPILEQHSLCRR